MCRVLIFNDHLYYIIQFILLSSMDHISITSTLIDGFFPHDTLYTPQLYHVYIVMEHSPTL